MLTSAEQRRPHWLKSEPWRNRGPKTATSIAGIRQIPGSGVTTTKEGARPKSENIVQKKSPWGGGTTIDGRDMPLGGHALDPALQVCVPVPRLRKRHVLELVMCFPVQVRMTQTHVTQAHTDHWQQFTKHTLLCLCWSDATAQMMGHENLAPASARIRKHKTRLERAQYRAAHFVRSKGSRTYAPPPKPEIDTPPLCFHVQHT